MMDKIGKEILRKNSVFLGIAAALQMLSGIFFFAGMLRTVRDVKAAMKQALIEHLTQE